MFILGAVLAGYPLYAKCGGVLVWLVVGAVLLFLFLSLLKPEPPRGKAHRRVTARHGYFAKSYDEYHANEMNQAKKGGRR